MVATLLNGNVVPVYQTFSDFPTSAPGGSLAVAYDSNLLYEFNTESHTWMQIGGGGGGSGTVTSVALTAPPILSVSGSPITSAGTIGLALVTQSANQVFAGPSSGSSSTPGFRSLVASDIPSLPYTNYMVNTFTLSANDIVNKFVTLSSTPANPTLTVLDVVDGPTQVYSVDYTISGATLSWSGLFLDGVLSSGDILTVQFY